MKLRVGAIVLLILVFASGSIFAQTTHQFDIAKYKSTAESVIVSLMGGNVDVIADLETLLTIGVDGCTEHMSEAETPEIEQELMQLVIDNSSSLTALTLAEIEDGWHAGSVPAAQGIDIDTFDHFSEVLSHYDMVIHPATAIICINAYAESADQALIDQAKDELIEVLTHVFILEAGAVSVPTEHQFDIATYKSTAESVIASLNAGNVDVIADLEALLAIGVEGCQEHMSEAETPEAEKALMQLVIDNSSSLTTLTLAEIEDGWHAGSVPAAQGIDLESFDHYSEVLSHYDMVIHPATAIICLNAYAESADQALIDQAIDELSEVLEHVNVLELDFYIAKYKSTAESVIASLMTGNVDVIADLEELVSIGIKGCEIHIHEAGTPDVEKALMQLVIDNSSSLTTLTLAEIEDGWHAGSVAAEQGIDLETFDHFSEVLSHYDMVIHPATAIICLNAYAVSADQALIDQALDELIEVLTHVFVLEAGGISVPTVHQFDIATYKSTAESVIASLNAGNVDVIADLETLLAIGVEGCQEHMGEAETPESEKALMQLVIDNSSSLTALTLAEIEDGWHAGSVPAAQGIDLETFDHFSEVLSHYDMVIHPATAIICINAYAVSADQALIDQAKDELAEVLEHVGILE